jgi:rSAM/selenodomain-associated transferase 1
MSNALIVFVKAPRLGTVKTRLARELGESTALEIYQSLVQKVLASISAFPNVELRFTPDDAENEIQPWLRPGWVSAPQGDGDLGARLHRAFTTAFANGATRVILIGSDCPALSADDIQAAWCALESHDVVLGPATDGGYWLIALRSPQPTLFENMTWSTPSVLAETLVRAAKRRLATHQLRPLSDIDTAEDWRLHPI